jgi:hypothetical protein
LYQAENMCRYSSKLTSRMYLPKSLSGVSV